MSSGAWSIRRCWTRTRRAFQQGLEALIQRTRDPELRRTFEGMRRCPVRGRNGRCSRFTDYILGALLRNGCHHEYDVEDALQRIVFRMLSPVGERGKQRRTIFDFDEDRPFDLRLGNPIEVVFKVYLANEIRNILGGRIPALRTRQKTGTLSIGYGKDTGEVSPDEIPDRMPSGEQEMLRDIMELAETAIHPGDAACRSVPVDTEGRGDTGTASPLRARQGGHDAEDHRAGHRAIRPANPELAPAAAAGQVPGFRRQPPRPRPPSQPRPPKPSKPVYPPDEQDYRSIVDVLEKHGRSVSMMVLGKVRRRGWNDRHETLLPCIQIAWPMCWQGWWRTAC